MGINLSDTGDVKRGINSLVGNVLPYFGMALPLLKKISPKIKAATGFSVDELYNSLNGVSESRPAEAPRRRAESPNLHNKYKNL